MNYELGQNLITQLFEIFFSTFNILFNEVISLAIPAIGILMLSALCGSWVASHRSSLVPIENGRKEEAPQ